MGSTRRRFTEEYNGHAVRLVLDSGNPIAEIARSIGVHEMTLGKWVKKARDDGEESQRPLDENERAELERGLRQALRREELWLAYQPVVDLASGRTLGCEALLRWRSPEHGEVSPARFIPVAEERGLITDLGRWVLRGACAQAAAWAQASETPRMAFAPRRDLFGVPSSWHR